MYKYKSLEQVQLQQEHLSFLQILLSQKYLKQVVDDNLIWRLKDLSMSSDQKVMTLLPPMEKCPIKFYDTVAFTA